MTDTISVKEFSLLMHSLEREYATSKEFFSIKSSHVSYYPGHATDKHIYISLEPTYAYVSIGTIASLMCRKPWFFSSERKMYDNAVAIYCKMTNTTSTLENIICDIVPSAKEIIAEQALVDDHE
jgi:hypothetical protein